MQKCYRCGLYKAADDFAWRRKAKNQRDSFCRPCRSAYKREHYLANKQRYIDRAAARKKVLNEERTAFLFDYFAAHTCCDCGESDPVVLEFDHLRDKRFSIGASLCTQGWESILREIAKCEVVCANCHRRRTAQRGDTRRASFARLLRDA